MSREWARRKRSVQMEIKAKCIVTKLSWSEIAMRSQFRVSKMAQLLNVSIRTLERKFFLEFGTNPRAWLVRIRIAEAVDLLAQGERVKAVAVRLGYSSVAQFSRYFKQQTGQSPRGFRRKLLTRQNAIIVGDGTVTASVLGYDLPIAV